MGRLGKVEATGINDGSVKTAGVFLLPEDPQIEAELEPLRDCRMSRSWGAIRIECVDAQHLEEVSALLSHLRRPLVAMGLDGKSFCACRDASTLLPDAHSFPQRSLLLELGITEFGHAHGRVDHQDLAKRGET